MEENIVRGDKGYRLQVVVIVVFFLGAFAWLVGYLIPDIKLQIKTLLDENRLEEVKALLIEIKYYMMGAMFLLVPFGSSLIFKGMKAVKTALYPFPGMRVLRDTYVLEGKDAQVRGYILIFLAVVLILSGIVLTIMASMLVDSLIQSIR